MNRDFLAQLVQKISAGSTPEKDERPLLPNHVEGLSLIPSSFHSLPQKRVMRVTFVDGGNLPLISTAEYQIQLLRFYGAIWEGKKKSGAQQSECYTVLTSKNKDGSIVYDCELVGEKVPLLHKAVFDSFDEHLRTGNNRLEFGSVANLIRRLCELAMLEQRAQTDRFIVYDGSLIPATPYEKPYIDALIKTLKRNKGVIIALSKTSTLLTNHGHSVVGVLSSLDPGGAWYYAPVVEHTKSDFIMCFAKLHTKSRHIFRLEAYPSASWDDLLSPLISQCSDPAFFGYPYGLVDADRSARVSFDEASYLKTMLLTHMRKKIKRLDWYLAGLNAHEKLDTMR